MNALSPQPKGPLFKKEKKPVKGLLSAAIEKIVLNIPEFLEEPEDWTLVCEDRVLYKGQVKIGKTWTVSKDAFQYLTDSRNTVTIYCTLNSLTIAEQEEQNFKENGFTNVINLNADNIKEFSQNVRKNKINLKGLVVIFRVEDSHYESIRALMHKVSTRKKHKLHLILDEYDYQAMSVQGYAANKTVLWEFAKLLRKRDRLSCVSATHSQLLNMQFSFTRVVTILPYKDNYRSCESHIINKLGEKELENFYKDGILSDTIKYLIDQAKPDKKLGISITAFVNPRDDGKYCKNIAEKCEQLGKKVYLAIGNKPAGEVPRTCQEYIDADIVVIGQPGGRALDLPWMAKFIYEPPRLISEIEQRIRITGYNDNETVIWTSPLGAKRIEAMLTFRRDTDWDYIATLPWEEKKKLEYTLPDCVQLFSKEKRGGFKGDKTRTEPVHEEPFSIEKYEECLADNSMMDEILEIPKDGWGRVKYGQKEDGYKNILNECAWTHKNKSGDGRGDSVNLCLPNLETGKVKKSKGRGGVKGEPGIIMGKYHKFLKATTRKHYFQIGWNDKYGGLTIQKWSVKEINEYLNNDEIAYSYDG